MHKFDFEKFHLKHGSASPRDIYQSMQSNLNFNPPEAVILMCAIVVASVGLNVGSTAVVIGAMLISPIMGPIQSIGYAIAIGDKYTFRRALKLLIVQILIALIASVIYFKISPLKAPTDELLSRTGPTFWDVIIAFFGGLAGIIGVTRAEKSNVIPGVAIATALMPPLATAGYGLALMNFSYFTGAFYLFIINAVFITIATIIGVSWLGIRKKEIEDVENNRKSRIQLQLLLLVVIIPSIFSSITLIRQQVVSANVESFINEEVETDTRKVVNTEIDYELKEITLIVVGTHLSDQELTVIESHLETYSLNGYEIFFVQNALSDTIDETIRSILKTSDESEAGSQPEEDEITYIDEQVSSDEE